MRVVRLVFAGLLAFVALVAGIFTLVLAAVVGLLAYLLIFFRLKTRAAPPRPSPVPGRDPGLATDDAIDVVTTKVPTDRLDG